MREHVRGLLVVALLASGCGDRAPVPAHGARVQSGEPDAAADVALAPDLPLAEDRTQPRQDATSGVPDRPPPPVDAAFAADAAADLPPPSDAPPAPEDVAAPPRPDVPAALDAPGLVDVAFPFPDLAAPAPDAPPPDAPPPADVPRDAADAGGGPVACAAIATREPVTLYLSADDSNSMASPVIARREIRRGRLVTARSVRTWEFLNYYNVPYAPAAAGSVRVSAAMRAGLVPGSYELQAGVASEARAREGVRPLALTLVLDDSGSMVLDDRVGRARAVVRAIASSLREGDVVSAVTWNTSRRVLLSGHRATGPGDPAVLAVAAALSPADSTDLSSGLRAGYELARAHRAPGRLNRLVLVSDGEANVGLTDAETIARESRAAEGEEIYLVGVGVGDGFNDTLMDAVTDRGRGAYVFVDTDAEARAMFGPRFVEAVDLAARAVRLELTLPWYMRVAEFSGEAVSGDPGAVEPQHLAPNDAMVFRQVLQACSPDVVAPGDRVRLRATYETPDRRPASEALDVTMADLLDAGDAELRRGRAVVAWAEALKRVEPLARRGTRADVAAAHGILADVRALAAAVPGAPDDPAMQEIVSLVDAYRAVVVPR